MKLGKVLGEGSFGKVYQSIEQNKHYAIKKSFPLAEDHGRRVVVFTELMLLLVLNNKYVVEVKGHGFDDDCLYIKMEYCSCSLQDMIDRKSKLFQDNNANGKQLLDFFTTCEMIRDIASGLMYLHSNSAIKPAIIHRDLSPANILVSTRKNKYQLKICDFGLSTFETSPSIGHCSVMAKINYMAPELQWNNGKMFHNCKADIYSLGRIAQELFNYQLQSFQVTQKNKLELSFLILSKLINWMTIEDELDLRPMSCQVLRVIQKVTLGERPLRKCLGIVKKIINTDSLDTDTGIFARYLKIKLNLRLHQKRTKVI